MRTKERWATRIGLVLAMAGNAVGLGNFLRFPAQAAANGGGAFLIPYLVALILIGLPLIWVEWAMGRYGGLHGHHSAPGIFQAHSRNGIWKYFGVLGLWSGLAIASFYLYIESWCLTYAAWAAIGGFNGVSTEQVGTFFSSLTGEQKYQFLAFSPWGLLVFAICISINVYILSRGLAKGIELVCKIGMPLLILFAIALAIRGLMIDPATDSHAKESPLVGLNFVWNPDFSRLDDPSVWLAAAGQIFFTLSIGMGTIHCYASYLREKDDVALTGQTAAWTNEFCEVILGGTILIPIAVAYLGLAAVQAATQGGSGFGLGFFVFPTLFSHWGPIFGAVAGFMWFGLLFFAAITSSLAMGQPIMAFLQQEFKFTREKSALAFGLLLLPLALPVALMHSTTFFDELDYWAGTVMLVVFALGEAILFAWVFGMKRGWEEINKGGEIRVPGFVYVTLKYITPVFLLFILLAYVFQPAAGWKPYLTGWASKEPIPAWQWSSGSMIGKLLHIDVANEKQSKLEAISARLKELQLDPTARAAEIAKQSEAAKTLEGASRDAAEARFKALQADEKLAPDKLAEARTKQQEELASATTFYEWLPFYRNIDRLAMVALFVFFAILVAVAWSRRPAPSVPA